MLEMWTYRTTVVLEPAVDLTGFKVEAVDGSIDESTSRPSMPARATSWLTLARGSSAGRSSGRPR